MHTRHVFFAFLLAVCLTSAPQPRCAEVDPTQALALYSLLGTVTVEDAQWQRLDFRPHLHRGRLEAAFDIELFLDETGHVRDLGWDFSTRKSGLESIFRKIHFIRYGDAHDPGQRVYFRLGDLEDVTLGQGSVMRHYRNDLAAPGLRKTGLDLQIREIGGGTASFRGVISSLLDLDGGGPVVGGRLGLHPGRTLEFGTTVVVDLDQLSSLPDSLSAGQSRDAYGMAGIDVVYHLMNTELSRLDLFGGLTRSLAGGSGFGLHGPGIAASVGGLSGQLGYRWMDGRIRPGHFDTLYELNRALYDAATDSIITRQAALVDVRMQGLFGDLRLSLGPVLFGQASYQHLTGGGSRDRRLEGRIGLRKGLLDQLPRLSLAEAYYENRKLDDAVDFFEPTSDTRFGYRLGINPIPRLTVYSRVEFTYEPDEAGGYRRRRLLNLQSVIGL
jgi:hypothetical protein